jgi:hypothetical protein
MAGFEDRGDADGAVSDILSFGDLAGEFFLAPSPMY